MVCADPALEHSGSRITATTSGTTSRRCGSSRRGRLGQRRHLDGAAAGEPKAAADDGNPGNDVTHSFELTVAPWFSMNLCDPKSDPQVPCTPRSTPTRRAGTSPAAETPSWSCSSTRPASRRSTTRSAATTRTGARRSPSTASSATPAAPCNNNCIEPVNFAFIQRDGVPVGPPSPQESDLQTFTPNAQTLMMNQGDRIVDPHVRREGAGGHAFEVREHDLTTGRSGTMIASAANGFKNTSIADCSGTPFNFQPEYSTAKAAEHRALGLRPVQDQHPVRDRALRAVHDA